jgi:hypothetical protein
VRNSLAEISLPCAIAIGRRLFYQEVLEKPSPATGEKEGGPVISKVLDGIDTFIHFDRVEEE